MLPSATRPRLHSCKSSVTENSLIFNKKLFLKRICAFEKSEIPHPYKFPLIVLHVIGPRILMAAFPGSSRQVRIHQLLHPARNAAFLFLGKVRDKTIKKSDVMKICSEIPTILSEKLPNILDGASDLFG